MTAWAGSQLEKRDRWREPQVPPLSPFTKPWAPSMKRVPRGVSPAACGFPKTPTHWWQGGIAVVIWNSPGWFPYCCVPAWALSAWLTPSCGCPDLCFRPGSPGLGGKEGVKACKCESLSLWYRAAASRSFLQHKRSEIQLAQLPLVA